MAKVPSSEHRRIAIACRNLYANIRHSTHSTWMNHFPFGIPFPPFYRNERINFWTICVDNRSARLPAKKKMENLVTFYGWYNSIPLLFLVPKKNYHLSLTENFVFFLTKWAKIMFEQFLNFRILYTSLFIPPSHLTSERRTANIYEFR